jgi:hypothetical protein
MESAARTRPITFAQTTVEAPKYGASSREAQISVAVEPAPAARTSHCSLAGGRLTSGG